MTVIEELKKMSNGEHWTNKMVSNIVRYANENGILWSQKENTKIHQVLRFSQSVYLYGNAGKKPSFLNGFDLSEEIARTRFDKKLKLIKEVNQIILEGNFDKLKISPKKKQNTIG
ncbi:MAG: hypothetical protein ACRC4M_02720 [Mycoplasma sp.]